MAYPPEDIPTVDPSAMTDLHPLDVFEQLRNLVTPQARSGPAPVSIPHMPAPVRGGKVTGGVPSGDGWRGLLQLLAPVIGGLAAGGGVKQTGFLNGYSEGQQLVAEDRQRKADEAQKKSLAAAQYLQRISEQADKITDPTQHAHFVDVADTTGARAKLTEPGEIKGQVVFDRRKLAEQQLSDLSKQLDAFEKGGYNLDDLAQSGAIVQLKDGTPVPITTAMDLVRSRPVGANGKPLAKPDKAAGTEEERYIAKWAKEQGFKVENLTSDQELKARSAFRAAGRAEPTVKPEVDPSSPRAQYANLVELWKLKNPGQEPPADVRSRLATDANKVNDKAATGFGGPAGNSQLDPEGIDYAATEYRVTGKMPALGMGNGAARAAIINGAAKQARTLGQSAAAAIQKQAAYKADAGSLNQITRMAAAAEAFENKALAQADIVDSLSAKVSRTNYPIINDGLLTFKARVLGDANTQLLYNALTTFTTEYAKIMEGSTGSAAGSSESARAAAAKLISAGLNKGTLAQTVDLMKREMRLTIQGYDATKAHITERMGGKAPEVPAAGRIYYDANGNPVKR